MKVEPLDDRVVVARLGEKKITAGGSIIPESAREKSQEDRIVAVGPGKVDEKRLRQEMLVKKIDCVLFSRCS